MTDRLTERVMTHWEDTEATTFTVTYSFDSNTGLTKEVEASNEIQADVAFGAWAGRYLPAPWEVTRITVQDHVSHKP